MHKILQRQMKKFLNEEIISGLTGKWNKFLDAVSETYKHFDDDRELMERSLEISSRELNEANASLQKEVLVMNEQKEELADMNNIMMNREYKIIELKKEISRLKGEPSEFEDFPEGK